MSGLLLNRLKPHPSSFLSALVRHAAEDPLRIAFTLLDGASGEAQATLTFGDLDHRARRIATWLSSETAQGDVILLAAPANLDYIAAFVGCLYAGRIVVPAFVPRLNRRDSRVEAIVKNCGASVALTSAEFLAHLQGAKNPPPHFTGLRWLTIEEIASPPPGEAQAVPDANSIAFLQYTSGSTATPKGVIVTHGNLAENERMLQQTFGVTAESVIVGWLPLHHDMGLIGNVLQAIYSGCHCVLLPPAAFLQRPVSWLRAISRFRGSISGGPNFAYDLCADRIAVEDLAELNLSSWKVAFNGSECVRAETLGRFGAVFACAGFSAESWRPCYGLAEATLLVSAARPEQPIRFLEAPGATMVSRTIVPNGPPTDGVRIVIVDQVHKRAVPAGETGEICVSGKSVARGYWNDRAATCDTFGLRIPGEDEPLLRTGDLGFLREGQLFINGRIKDVIVVRGRNHYAHDIERSASRSHPALRGLACAALAIETGSMEEFVLLQEIRRGDTGTSQSDISAAIRRTTAEEHGVAPDRVVFVPAHSLPKTTSGKLKRARSKDLYLAGSLAVIGVERLEQPAGEPATADRDYGGAEAPESILRDLASRILGVSPGRIDPELPLAAYGLDSLSAVQLKSSAEEAFSVALPDSCMSPSISLKELAARSLEAPPANEGIGSASSAEYPLTAGQRALWFLEHLQAAPNAYNLPLVARLRGALDESLFRRAFEKLAERHAVLRTVFHQEAGVPVQRICERPGGFYLRFDASAWSEQELATRIAAQVNEPFQLETGPVFRVALFERTNTEAVVVFCAHHIVVDFWSLSILFREAELFYQGRSPAGVPLAFGAHAIAESELLSSDEGQRMWQYWRRQLDGAPPSIGLESTRPAPAVRSMRGAAVPLAIGKTLSRRLNQLARKMRVSTYSLLLSAFQALLYRHTGQTDLIVGTPALGRSGREWMNTPGYFINPVLIRSKIEGALTFSRLAETVQLTLRDALQHQRQPFSILIEKLRSERHSAPPLIEAMFIHLGGGSRNLPLGVFALGQTGASMSFGDLTLESVAFDLGHAHFDLTMTVVQSNEILRGELRYSTDIFDEETIRQMADRYLRLVEGIAHAPDASLSALPLLSAAEQRRLIHSFNRTRSAYRKDACVNDEFSRVAALSPGAPALVAYGCEITYGELDAMSERIAEFLRSRGAGAGALVAVHISRSAEMVAALLGVLRAGAAYVPLDGSYPAARVEAVLDAARPMLVLTDGESPALNVPVAPVAIALSFDQAGAAMARATADSPCYVIFTSGSTGAPKGVVVTHRNVQNLFHAMDRQIGCGPADTVMAATSISFDISVLELLWPLCRGARVVLMPEQALTAPARKRSRPGAEVSFSLFYFANADAGQDKYRLLLEGARYADEHAFEAVWTPERHFHEFGGLYPNPAVTAAAVAAVTKTVGVRAGSVVLPLHDPLRVAEEWSVVDNLSRGRVGVAFASGWHADDFVLNPATYVERKRVTFEGLEIVRNLWRGGALRRSNGNGQEVEIRIFPRPHQPELPVWITAAGSEDTFIAAGKLGANVLTHLLGQDLAVLEKKIRLYRGALAEHGFDPASGRVTLMLHTLVGDDVSTVKRSVEAPFTSYLRSSVGLMSNLARSLGVTLDIESMMPRDMQDLLCFAFDRYFDSSALFGTPSSLLPVVGRLSEIGVDEAACLIDFGVESEQALGGLEGIVKLRARASGSTSSARMGVGDFLPHYRPSLLQSTPSFLRMLAAQPGALESLRGLRTLIVGGEAMPPDLAERVRDACGCRMLNMYGPTETTVWSSCGELDKISPVTIGRPVANTQIYVLDHDLNLLPAGLTGEIFIGGDGVAMGYLNRPDLTAAAFRPDSFGSKAGGRVYRTGDFGRYLADGRIEFLGRRDQQVKIRGVRIELGEIENALAAHPEVRESAVVVSGTAGDPSLIACYVAPRELASSELRARLAQTLHPNAVPASLVRVDRLPLTPNGKIDRTALLAAVSAQRASSGFVPLSNEQERMVAEIWRGVLKLERVGADENFFDVGGHSLLVVQVQAELRRMTGREVPVSALLQHPTIRSLGEYLRGAESEPGTSLAQERACQTRDGLARQRDQGRQWRERARGMAQ